MSNFWESRSPDQEVQGRPNFPTVIDQSAAVVQPVLYVYCLASTDRQEHRDIYKHSYVLDRTPSVAGTRPCRR